MKNEELFHKTVAILVKAYLNNTLEHGNCCACAVGNIIAANLRISINPVSDRMIKNGWERSQPLWQSVFQTDARAHHQLKDFSKFTGLAKKQILVSGYSLEQLMQIEFAFETAPDMADYDFTSLDDTWMYNGLMAVIDVLCEIHEMNEEVKQETKALFVKP